MLRRISIILLMLLGVGVIGSYFVAGLLSSSYQQKIEKPLVGVTFEDVTFQSSRGNDLHGWFLKGEVDRGGVLLMHGVRSSRMQMVDRAVWLHRKGYSVLLFDFQAHGESLGEHITFGHLESEDAMSAYNYLSQRLTYKKIAVIGVSLGGASALLSDIPNQADALVIESVYPTIEEAVANRISMHLGDIGRHLTPLLLWQVEPRLGFDPNRLRPIEGVGIATSPLLIIGGENDLHTTQAETVRIYDRAKEPKALWIVPNAVHQDIYRFVPQLYEERVGDFLQQYL